MDKLTVSLRKKPPLSVSINAKTIPPVTEELRVTPNEIEQVFTAEGNVTGYSPVIVDAVDMPEIPLWTTDGKVYYQTLTFPDTVTSIGDFAYYSGGKIKKIILGDNITSIGRNAFYYCNIVEEIVFSRNLKTIGHEAFRLCGRNTLTKVDLMNTSVTSIGQNAFRNCEVLTDLLLPNTLTSTVVGTAGSFATCDKLKNVTLQEGILCDLDFSASVEFTTEDLVNMLNSLGTVPSGETKTFTIGVTNLEKLTDTQKQIATDKGWTLA